MRVGVEIGVLGPARAGVARYVWNMVREMMRAAPEVEFVFYAGWPTEIPLPPGNWRLREPAGRFRRVFELWVQEDLPRLLAADGIDVFWGQGFVMPSRRFGRCLRVLTVHDLTSKLFPQSMELHTRLSYGALLPTAARAADRVVV
ncbi:MAG: glycosyltransferase, partial [candidate division WOR-3 bacterium]